MGMDEILILGGAAIVMLALLLALVILYLAPAFALVRAVRRLGAGDLETPVPARWWGGLGLVASSLEQLRLQTVASLRRSHARAAVGVAVTQNRPLSTSLKEIVEELTSAVRAAGSIMLVNESALGSSFTVTSESLAGVSPQDIAGSSQVAALATAVQHWLPQQQPVEEGAPPWLASYHTLCGAPLFYAGKSFGLICVLDAVDCAEADRELVASIGRQVASVLDRYRVLGDYQRQAITDGLTGLHNYRFLVDHLDQQVALAHRTGIPLSLLMLDIDHFKEFNDSHGHPAGDAALCAFANSLKETVRRADLVARYGGEEFVVVMANASRSDSLSVAEKIRSTVQQTRFLLPGKEGMFGITVSIGVALLPGGASRMTGRELIQAADAALYQAKHLGRNRVVFYEGTIVDTLEQSS